MPDPLADLRGYLEWLESRGLLLKVNEPLSPILEIPAFLRRIMYMKGPTVVFENVKGYPEWRIAGNLYPNINIVKEFLGVNRLEEIGDRIIKLTSQPPPISFSEKIGSIWKMRDIASYLPRKARKASFMENEKSSEPLKHLPLFKTWPKDGGRYITLGLVFTRDPELGVTNIGVYRIMEKTSSSVIVHWQVHKRGALAFKKAIERGEELPIAIVLGTDPATILAGISPVPYPIDKLLFAGVLKGRSIDVYELENNILVPSNAEAVLTGYIEPGKLSKEGPFGDHWGFYDEPLDLYPVARIEKLYYRENPIYPGTIVGLPPLEDSVMGKVVERVFLPIMKIVFPEIIDVNFPVYGAFQGAMIVSIRKRYPWHGKKILLGLWGVGQTSLTKMIIVVDSFINVHNINQVLWALTSFVDPGRDIVIIHDAHTDALDPSAKAPSVGSKIGIDATVKFKEESGREPPDIVAPDETVEEKIKAILEKYGLVGEDPWKELIMGYQNMIRAWYRGGGGYTH